MSSVEIIGLRKKYNELTVIHDIDLAIADGKFVVLVGPSGCGKSTLLRMIAGLEGITGGVLKIGDTVANDIPSKSRDIAMVFQNYALYPHLTVRDNMAFSLKLRKVPKETINRRVEEVAATLGLSQLLERHPRQLSGGQRQRVAMGRAVVREPKVFLFDEPLSNLDAKLRVQMRTEMKQLHQRLGTTTIYVTHDQIEAMTLGDIVVVMREGNIEQMGEPIELYDRPANQFVAGFLGSPSMNFIPGVIAADGRSVKTAGDQVLPLAQQRAEQAGRQVVYGVRPEQFQITPDGTLAARVLVIEPTGAETIVMLTLEGKPESEICVVLRDRLPLVAGQQVRLAPTAGAEHIFDAETGKRI